jgi:hypothetical protein
MFGFIEAPLGELKMQIQRDEDEKNEAEANPKPGRSDSPAGEHTVGAFGGEKDQVVRTRHGKPIPSDTGDQGGGQN